MGWLKWLYPGLKIKRWLILITAGFLFTLLGLLLVTQLQVLLDLLRWTKNLTQGWLGSPAGPFLGLLSLAVGMGLAAVGFQQLIRSVVHVILPDPPAELVDIIYNQRSLKKGPKIVAIGGGTGLSVLLRGLKEYTSNITAIVSVADDGGSSGRLRSELGILPPGDLRNCLIALADGEKLMEELLGHRFQCGTTLAGHSVGNLLLAGLAELKGDFHLAIQELSRVLAIRGRVIPATLTPPVLGAELVDGEIIRGQSKIAHSPKKIKRVFLEPEQCRAVPEALAAIREADLIVLGPGSLYTSVIPNLLIRDIKEALLSAKAPVVYVCNVATQPGETAGYSVSQHVKGIRQHGGDRLIDIVVVNTAKPRELPPAGQPELVTVDYRELRRLGVQVVNGDVIDHQLGVRHDARQLGRLLIQLLLRQKGRRRGRLRMLGVYLRERFQK